MSEAADDAPPLALSSSFDVYCDQPLPPEAQMAVARCIERWKPVHARYKLRVRKGARHETLEQPAAVRDDGVTPPELRAPFDDDEPGRGSEPAP